MHSIGDFSANIRSAEIVVRAFDALVKIVGLLAAALPAYVCPAIEGYGMLVNDVVCASAPAPSAGWVEAAATLAAA